MRVRRRRRHGAAGPCRGGVRPGAGTRRRRGCGGGGVLVRRRVDRQRRQQRDAGGAPFEEATIRGRLAQQGGNGPPFLRWMLQDRQLVFVLQFRWRARLLLPKQWMFLYTYLPKQPSGLPGSCGILLEATPLNVARKPSRSSVNEVHMHAYGKHSVLT